MVDSWVAGQGLREVVWGPSLGLVNSEKEGLTFRLQGSPWPTSIDFRVKATGLTSQLNLGDGFVIVVVDVVASERCRAPGSPQVEFEPCVLSV